MRTINNKFFETKNISRKSNIILDKTNQICKNKNIIKFCKMVSEHTSIPEKDIIFYFKKKYFNSFNFKKNQFDKKIFLFSAIKYLFLYIFFIIMIFFFKKKNKIDKAKKIDLLIDDVSDLAEIERYNNLRNLFESNIVRINKKLKIKNKKNKVIFRKNFYNYSLSSRDLFFFIKMFYQNILFSLSANLNINYFFLSLINDYYFYSSFFEDYKFKYAISSRHFVTKILKIKY